MKHGFIKTAAATPKLREADPEYNGSEIICMMGEAAGKGAKLIVFPELCITGYTCGDLFLQEPLLRGAREHSRFWPILAHFMDYYSPFWGPKAISIIVELQGALTCRSSTITIWADSGPFLALLLYFGVLESFR